MTWIKSRVGLVRCRRVRRLSADLGIIPVCAIGHLHAFWHAAMEEAGDGDVTDWTDDELAEAAAWTDDPALLRTALRRHGFLTMTEDDAPRELIGDWQEIGGTVVYQRERNRINQAHSRERRKQADAGIGDAETLPTPLPMAPKTARKPRKDSGAGDPAFDRFWAVYPRRDAKADALAAWRKLAPDDDTVDLIIRRVVDQAQATRWQEEGGRFIPLPATYLNGRRWTDEGAAIPATTPVKRLAI